MKNVFFYKMYEKEKKLWEFEPWANIYITLFDFSIPQ